MYSSEISRCPAGFEAIQDGDEGQEKRGFPFRAARLQIADREAGSQRFSGASPAMGFIASLRHRGLGGRGSRAASGSSFGSGGESSPATQGPRTGFTAGQGKLRRTIASGIARLARRQLCYGIGPRQRVGHSTIPARCPESSYRRTSGGSPLDRYPSPASEQHPNAGRK